MKSKVKIGVIDTDGSYNDINFSKCNISKLNKTIKFRYINKDLEYPSQSSLRSLHLIHGLT